MHIPNQYNDPNITPKITVTVEFVTPELAAKWLEMNTSNRPIRSRVADQLYDAITGGQFITNGSAITFTENGVVADGQHRLKEIVRAKIGCWLLVARNADPRVLTTSAVGSIWTASDLLAHQGEIDTKTLAGALRVIHRIQRGYRGMGLASNAAVAALLDRHPDVVDSVRLVRNGPVRNVLPAALLSGCHYFFRKVDTAKADLYLEVLGAGGALSDNHPINHLRNALLKQPRNTRWIEENLAALIIKSWNAFAAGEAMAQLKYSSKEAFPKIANLPD